MFERIQQMDRRTLAALTIAVVVAILGFSAVSSGIRQAGWNEGYLMGQLSSGSNSDGAVTAAPYLATRSHGVHGWGWHPFWIIGGFFRFLFFGFLIMLFFKFIARRRWAHYGGDGHHHWRHHGHHHWGDHGATHHDTNREDHSQEKPTADVNSTDKAQWTQL